jgi:hypothetical protein
MIPDLQSFPLFNLQFHTTSPYYVFTYIYICSLLNDSVSILRMHILKKKNWWHCIVNWNRAQQSPGSRLPWHLKFWKHVLNINVISNPNSTSTLLLNSLLITINKELTTIISLMWYKKSVEGNLSTFVAPGMEDSRR